MQHYWAAFVLMFFLVTAAAAQEGRATLGVLTCTLGDKAALACGFKPSGSGAEEKYVGTVGGREAAPAAKVVLIFAVSGRADMKLSAGMLAQRYVRANSQMNQPPTLVGENDPSIVLQFETNNGGALSDGITFIDLKLTTTPA